MSKNLKKGNIKFFKYWIKFKLKLKNEFWKAEIKFEIKELCIKHFEFEEKFKFRQITKRQSKKKSMFDILISVRW